MYNKSYDIVEEVHDVEFDETNGSQVEDNNLDDVRGVNLQESMKNKAIGDIQPRVLEEEEDDSITVITPTSTISNLDNTSASGTHDEGQVQVLDQVPSPSLIVQPSSSLPIRSSLMQSDPTQDTDHFLPSH